MGLTGLSFAHLSQGLVLDGRGGGVSAEYTNFLRADTTREFRNEIPHPRIATLLLVPPGPLKAQATDPLSVFGSSLARWYLERYASGVWQDETGNRNARQGTVGRRPSATTINGHAALSFSAASSTVLDGGDQSDEFITDQFTIGLVFSTSSALSATTVLLGKYYSGISWGVYGATGDKIEATVDQVEVATSDASLNDGQPHTLLVVQDATTLSIWIDGTLQATTGAYVAPGTSAAILGIGAAADSETLSTDHYTGALGNVFIATRAASAGEVGALNDYLIAWAGIGAAPIALQGHGLPAVTKGGGGALVGAAALKSRGAPMLVRWGGGAVGLGALALQSRGSPAIARWGGGALAPSTVAMQSRGAPLALRGGGGILAALALALQSRGAPLSLRGGGGIVSASSVSLVGHGAPLFVRGGAGAAAASTVAMQSRGAPLALRGGGGALMPAALALVGHGVPFVVLGGGGSLSVVLALQGHGAPARLLGGGGAVGVGSVGLVGHGAPALPLGGGGALAAAGLALQGHGAPAPRVAGGGALAPAVLALAGHGAPLALRGGGGQISAVGAVALVGHGLPAGALGGGGALALGLGVMALQGHGAPAALLGGGGALAPTGLALQGHGAPATLRGGASPLGLGALALVGHGVDARIRGGAGAVAIAGGVALVGHGAPALPLGGGGALTPAVLALVGHGLPAELRGGGGYITVVVVTDPADLVLGEPRPWLELRTGIVIPGALLEPLEVEPYTEIRTEEIHPMSRINIGDEAAPPMRVLVDGLEVDPATVSLTVRSPSGTTATYTYPSTQVEKIDVGRFRGRVPATEAGIWRYRWTTTGPAGVEEGSYTVFPATF